MLDSKDIGAAIKEISESSRIGIFLSTPMGPLDDASIELDSARS